MPTVRMPAASCFAYFEKVFRFSIYHVLKMLTKCKGNRYNSFCLFGVIIMILSIRELTLKGSPVSLSGTFDLSRILKEREDILSVGKVEAELTAVSERGLTQVEGTLTFPIEMPCSRCLQPVKETIAVPFMERFASRPEAVPKEDQDEVHLISEDHIKLDSYVEEAVWLALPLAPVCREDCEGLCPECGTNRNNGACGCGTEKIDPRLAGLADFFKT